MYVLDFLLQFTTTTQDSLIQTAHHFTLTMVRLIMSQTLMTTQTSIYLFNLYLLETL